MKLPNFKKFLIENLSDEDAAELGAMGFSNINANEIAELIDIHDFRIKAEGSKLLIVGDLSMPEDDFYLLQGIDMSELDLERDFWGEIQITLDFDNSTVTGSGLISQKDMDLWEEFDLDDIDWNDIFQNGDPSSMSSQEIAQEIESFLEVVHGYEDSSGYYDKIRELISDKVEQLTGREEDEDEDDNEEDDEDWMAEKKLLKFHDSDAPDANGKFKELGVQKLADWLIKTRGGNMQKITGSLNQQINFNKKKNPSYAKKMESTREASSNLGIG
mgnify:CR=1 FL=1